MEEFGLADGDVVDVETVASHRCAFLAELAKLNVERDQALACRPSAITRRTLARVAAYVFDLGQTSKLEQLVFLRFSGEVLTATEFKMLYERFARLKLLKSGLVARGESAAQGGLGTAPILFAIRAADLSGEWIAQRPPLNN